MIVVRDAQFLASATSSAHYPKGLMPEIGVVGRSNVGKSSLLNALLGRKKLVRVSNSPGRTRALNFFGIELSHGVRRHRLRLVDMPGYGFAKASKGERDSWRTMIESYVAQRRDLALILLLVDGEIGATEDDLRVADWLSSHQAPILCVATKIDRLPKAKRKPAVLRIALALALPPEAIVPSSATERLGMNDVWSGILSVLQRELPTAVPAEGHES